MKSEELFKALGSKTPLGVRVVWVKGAEQKAPRDGRGLEATSGVRIVAAVVPPPCLHQCSVFCQGCPLVVWGWGGQSELLGLPTALVPTCLTRHLLEQGEMINRIEKNILSSADYVERGQEHVKRALESQKKARKVSLLRVPPPPPPAPECFPDSFLSHRRKC